ncbi:10775_t:CDS:2, partial [Dentiscutata erythropus]
IVGNNNIISNITLGNCTGKESFDDVANYLANISVKDGNTHTWIVGWDNEGWICHNPNFLHNSDYTNQNCFMQLITSSPTINSTTNSTTPSTISSSSPTSSSSTKISVIIGCLI